jgi:hypothetical protein
MTKDLMPYPYNNLALANAEHQLSRFSNDREIADLQKESFKHIVAEQMQAAKAIAAQGLLTNIYDHAHEEAAIFTSQVSRRLEAAQRSEPCRAAYESITSSLLSNYETHLVALGQIAAMNLAREVHREVIVPHKRGWFR